MVSDALKNSAPDERFSRKVIDELLARPRPLEIEGHPVRQIWDLLRAALPDYEVIPGEEIEEKSAFSTVGDKLDRAYHYDKQRALRTQTTIATLKAMRGRKPPVRLLTAGRVFRPVAEDASHLKVFHQADGLCVQKGADVAELKAVCTRVVEALIGPAELSWAPVTYEITDPGLEAAAKIGGEGVSILGCGMLRAGVLRQAGFDPSKVGGISFGLGLERLAMIRFGIADVRKLWQAPYVTR